MSNIELIRIRNVLSMVVNLNSDDKNVDVGMKLKIIGISMTFGLNIIVLICYFFFSGLIN